MTRTSPTSLAALAVIAAFALTAVAPAAAEQTEEAAARPPANSPLAKIEKGMSEAQVIETLGSPASKSSYRTGKSRIPFYYGSDTRRRMWQYRSLGKVIFSKGRFSAYKVMRVEYNKDELAGVADQGDPTVVIDPTPTPRRPRVYRVRPRF